MAKPFSIQSPESIAETYGGNKQKIAQAAQMGIVDPTAAVMAGMFIDRMRSAQMQESGQQPTVAQQVMGGAPASPPVPPSGGLGATPQAAPPMAPQQPMPAPQGAPVGMADGGSIYAAPYTQGGLDSLPVPDTMFDESRNGGFDDGYAGGGLVAFAGGGGIDREALRRALIMQESHGDYGITNAEGSGAMGAYQFMPETARSLAARLGMDYRPELMTGSGGRSKKGKEYQDALANAQLDDILAFAGGDIDRAAAFHFAGPNESRWGPKTRKYQADIRRRMGEGNEEPFGTERAYTSDDPYEVPEAASLSDILGQLSAYTGKRSGEATQSYLEAMQLSPERRHDMKRMNEAAALAAAAEAFGSRGPLLGQIGTALGKATGTLAGGERDIRAAELEGLKAGMTEEQQAYLDRVGMLDPAARLRASELEVREAGIGRKARREEAEAERDWRSNEAKLDRELRREIEKAAALRAPSSDLETMIAIQQRGTAEQKAALVATLKLKQEYGSSGFQLPGVTPQGGAQAGSGQQSVVDVPWTQ